MDKKRGTEKPHPWPFDLLSCLLGVYPKYSNRAVTLIQQSCIFNTLIEQSPHAITEKLNKLSVLILRDLSDKKL